MRSCECSLPLVYLHFFLPVLIFIDVAEAQPFTNQRPFNNSVSAIFVFGDSTVDPGNNNYITTPFKGNFPPYGQDFLNHIPTGRFTNGRLVTDYIASYAGIKDYVPPYLDPMLSIVELMTGVSFASASSGYDPLTPKISGVISMQKQVEYFGEYKTRMEMAIGEENTNNLIKKAIFVISAGTNDFVINYFGPPIRQKSYTISEYQQFLLQIFQEFIQGLMDQGAEKVAIVGLPPMGCLPIVITLNSNDPLHKRDCIDNLDSVATEYNQLLQTKLKAMPNDNSKMILYADIYTPLKDMIQQPDNFGLNDTNTGCCGTGYFEASFLCSPWSEVCNDASKYVFWDSIHPTQSTYYFLFKALRPTVDQFLMK